MKTKPIFLFVALTIAPTLFASDIQVDGIWYDFDDQSLTASVTYRGSNQHSYDNEYTGSVVIPVSVSYNDKTYSVTTIGNDAFASCSSLTSIIIPNSITTIGRSAFNGCSKLTSVIIPNSITIIGGSAFASCSGLTSVTIPNSVTTIGNQAFRDCSGLTSITIPNSVTTIEYGAFCDCHGLTSITIPNSVTTIGAWAFQNVNNVVYSGTATGSPWEAKCVNGYVDGYLVYSDATKTTLCGCSSAAKGAITIPNSVTTIGKLAFYKCIGLTSITIPNSVTEIRDHTFNSCHHLTSVTIPNSVTTIGERAFYGCSDLTSITIPNSVTEIGDDAFQECSGLTSVTIPNSVTTIGDHAFYGCRRLTSVTIPNSVTTIGDFTFDGCHSLTSVTIPNSVTTIGDHAFYYCDGLTLVTIPNSVKTIGKYAFDYCESLTSVTCYATNPPTCGDHCWDRVNKSISVYVPVRSVYAYKNAVGWKDFTNLQANPDDIATVTCNVKNGTSTGANTYIKGENCTLTITPNCGYHFVQWSDGNTDNPRSFIITQDTTFEALCDKYYNGSCGDNAMWEYRNDTLFVSGRGAMYDYTSTTIPWFPLCDSISAIVIADNITRIGDYSFYGFSLIKEITLGTHLTSVGDFAFSECTNIRTITCKASSVVAIQSSTMNGVSNYAKVYVLATLLEDYQFDSNWRRFVIMPVGNTFIVSLLGTNGKVVGAGTYLGNTTIGISAIPNTGYHFTQWSDGNTDNPRSLVVTQDTTLEAQFAKNMYTITTTVNDLKCGIAQGGSVVPYMETITIFATPNYGYHFTQWSDGITDNPRYIVVKEDKTYTAQFDKNQYTVMTSKDANTGTVTEGGIYDYLDEITLSATPIANCMFVQWSDGNTDNPRVLVVSQDTSLTAISAKISSGKCGDNLMWNYNDGILVVSGTGAMYDYTQGTAPWTLFQDSISSLVINNGCTSIGNFAFYGLSNKNLKTIDIPNSVEQIGQYAFANCEYVKNLYLGLSLEKIAANAFANDERLLYITCYAIEPPLLDESAFANYDAYLSVPCESQADYKVSKGWKLFNKENVSCIGAEETFVTKDDITVVPTDNQATLTWPADDQAAGYSIEISKDGVVFCTLKFNAQGQLTGIAFAPSRGGEQRTMQAAEMTAKGWQFTVTGLTPGSKYVYTVDVINAQQQSIKHYEGEFTTTGATGLEQLTIDNAQCTVRKFIKDNQLYIFRGDKIYNAAGGLMK